MFIIDSETYDYLISIAIVVIVLILYYYLKPSKKLNDKQKKFKLTLEDITDILEQHDIHYFLNCGTALGCHREKKFIEHDEDIDLGIFEDISYQKIIDTVLKSNKFTLLRYFPQDSSNVNNLTEITFIHNETNIHLDIFKYFKKEDKYMSFAYNGKCSFKPRNRCEWLDPINLIQLNFLGRTYNVPDMDFIRSRYGSDWNIPKVESYDNQGSIIN